MAVQVLIKRNFVKEKAEAVAPLMVELRSLARAQQGYISSESLECIDPPGEDEYLIRSTWSSKEEWKRWLNSEERSAIQQQIDAITGEETQYRIYEPLVGGISPK
ncbi:MAG: antibiotic biosynthesis monooxygenase family protein [Thermodesulfobacteriota bacterium]